MEYSLKTVIGDVDNLTNYLRMKGANHRSYKYYSVLDIIEDNFLKHKYLYLSVGDNWNDIADYNRFNTIDSDVIRFGACFSFSKSESVPMWMLYGGLKKKGAMIDFSVQLIKSLISKTIEIELGYFRNGSFETVITIPRETFDIYVQDILYFGDAIKQNGVDSNTLYIKRSDETINGVSRASIKDDSIIRKRLGWSYENETRFVVEVRKETIREIAEYRNLKARISFESFFDDTFAHITLAPNYEGESRDYSMSNLTRELDWNLCKSECITSCKIMKGFT